LKIPFNKINFAKQELKNIENCIKKGHIAGDGIYTILCNKWFLKNFKRRTLLTHSCTCAIEMAAILAGLKPEDEVIMPSYSFVSTANAFVLAGAKPVFVDIKPDTLNINEDLIERAITKKTKAIVAVHYAGVGCEMDKLTQIAKKHGLYLFEDAALGFYAKYKDKFLGTIGDLGTYSFHETKSIVSGEGGALSINNKNFLERAEIIREKGTSRSKFFRGEVDKYTWVDKGSSYLPSDIIAAFLYAQFERVKEITKKRLLIWQQYHNFFEKYETKGLLRRPFVPEYCEHNGSVYYILFNDLKTRAKFMEYMKKNNIAAPFHYIPLHSSPGGLKYAKTPYSMKITDKISDTIVRLPLFYSITKKQTDRILKITEKFLTKEI
jgi:dTDP-4-amino-4,6-dideoxygalactose transaminase